jgi:hypothetical protein
MEDRSTVLSSINQSINPITNRRGDDNRSMKLTVMNNAFASFFLVALFCLLQLLSMLFRCCCYLVVGVVVGDVFLRQTVVCSVSGNVA